MIKGLRSLRHSLLSPETSTPVFVYVAGPMTGVPQQNFPLILDTRRRLAEMGYMVIDPVSVNINFLGVVHPDNPSIQAPGLKADMLALCIANAICLLPGWEQSRGARLEVAFAITMGFMFIDYQTGELVDRPPYVVITHGYSEDAPDGPMSYLDMWMAMSILINNVDGDSYAIRAEKMLKAVLFAKKLSNAVRKYALAFGVNPDRQWDFELTDEEIETVRASLRDPA